MNHGIVTAAYIVAAIFFIFSLAGLSRQESAKNGNLYGIIGMAIALVATLYGDSAGLGYILLAMVIGAAIGVHKARKVEMTQMPELIALLHSFVGLAAVLVGISSYAAPGDVAPEMHTIHLVEVFVGVFIGAVTFTGSLVAFGKLNGKISSKPLQLPGKHKLNLAALVASLILLAVFLKSSNPHETVETLYRLVNGKPEAAMVISNGASSAAAIAALTLMTLIALAFGWHLVASIGGGTTRDLLLNRHPLFWLKDLNYAWTITLTSLFTQVFYHQFERLDKPFRWFDALALATFTVIGIEVGQMRGASAPVAVLMGVITAVMGGILRDIVCRQVPLLLRKEIYLTAAMVGGVFYFVLLHAGVSLWVRDLLTLLLVLVIRGFAIVYNWNLPDIAIRRKP